jgi:hypothetical protein
MGEIPKIPIEKTEEVEIPDDGRITLGEKYAHRRVPLEIRGHTGETFEDAGDEYPEVEVASRPRYYEADSRGRITLPASVQERYNKIRYFVSEEAVEQGGLENTIDIKS